MIIFHEFCDNIPGTISIIKSNSGNMFGGYTSKSWTSGYYKYVLECLKDENAFLFLIKSDDETVQSKCPLLFELRKGRNDAICCYHEYGPAFGGGMDICIKDKCNLKYNYWSEHSYSISVNLCGNKKVYFKVIDYEVFQINQ